MACKVLNNWLLTIFYYSVHPSSHSSLTDLPADSRMYQKNLFQGLCTLYVLSGCSALAKALSLSSTLCSVVSLMRLPLTSLFKIKHPPSLFFSTHLTSHDTLHILSNSMRAGILSLRSCLYTLCLEQCLAHSRCS